MHGRGIGNDEIILRVNVGKCLASSATIFDWEDIHLVMVVE